MNILIFVILSIAITCFAQTETPAGEREGVDETTWEKTMQIANLAITVFIAALASKNEYNKTGTFKSKCCGAEVEGSYEKSSNAHQVSDDNSV